MTEPTDGGGGADTQDEELLADLFDTMLQEILEGRTPELQDYLPERPELQPRVAKTWSLACSVAGRREPSRPVLGGYEIVRELGHGGMGTVYKALHTKLKRIVALKVLPEKRLQDASAVARFEREMAAVGQLQHPNIVQAHDAGEHDGRHYLVMEYVEGADLSHLSGPHKQLPIPEACELIRQAAEGLQHAHDHGMVHRDIKPPNIILCGAGGIPDTAKLVDFGLVSPLLEPTHRRLTTEGHVIGTPRYVAPEMLRAKSELSPATDFYALGLVAYYLLAGRHAFDGASPAEILYKQRS
ncbi:MAG: serine/threonine protein kinase, partial [Planctomycetes bacterium]|nr:serine/threonine protein kinase [Planctomycetota bacterium]